MLVKIRPPYPDTGGAENVFLTICCSFSAGEPDDGKVRRTTAQIDYQRELFRFHFLLMRKCRGNRLILKNNVLESERFRNIFQRLLGNAVRFRIIIMKMHRPPEYSILNLASTE